MPNYRSMIGRFSVEPTFYKTNFKKMLRIIFYPQRPLIVPLPWQLIGFWDNQ